jgi:ABC-type multidrug transport system ATPase subunit
VTHDREEALTLADRIAVIDAGRVVNTAAGETSIGRHRRSSRDSWAPQRVGYRSGPTDRSPPHARGLPVRAHFTRGANRGS